MNISIQEILTQAAGFIILVFVLRKLFWQSMLQTLDNRREKIKTDLEKIESAKRDIERMKAEYTARMQKIEEEARVKIQQSIDEGRKIAKEIQEKARAEAQGSFEKAKENIELEVTKARMTLRGEIADLTVNATERILKEKMTDSRAQQEKVMGIIQDLEKSL